MEMEVVNELKTWLGGFDKRVTAKRARNREGRARHRWDRQCQTESRFAPAESFREECMLHKVRRGSEHDKFEQPRCVRFKMLGSVYPATLCVATPGRRLDRVAFTSSRIASLVSYASPASLSSSRNAASSGPSDAFGNSRKPCRS
jgi:hypothetical protein